MSLAMLFPMIGGLILDITTDYNTLYIISIILLTLGLIYFIKEKRIKE